MHTRRHTCPLAVKGLDVSRTIKKAGFNLRLRVRLELCKEHKLNGLFLELSSVVLFIFDCKKRSGRQEETRVRLVAVQNIAI